MTESHDDFVLDDEAAARFHLALNSEATISAAGLTSVRSFCFHDLPPYSE